MNLVAPACGRVNCALRTCLNLEIFQLSSAIRRKFELIFRRANFLLADFFLLILSAVFAIKCDSMAGLATLQNRRDFFTSEKIRFDQVIISDAQKHGAGSQYLSWEKIDDRTASSFFGFCLVESWSLLSK